MLVDSSRSEVITNAKIKRAMYLVDKDCGIEEIKDVSITMYKICLRAQNMQTSP